MQTLNLTKKYEQYPEYKNSGVEWLGKIPSKSNVDKIKNIIKINRNVLPENTNGNFTFKYFDIGSVEENRILEPDTEILFSSAPSRARRIIRSGDTIIATVRTYLRAVAYFENINENFIASTGFAVLSPKETILPKFLYYYVKSHKFIERVVAWSKGVSYPAITPYDLGSFEIAYPNKEEQIRIANYLDAKTQLIDQIIEKKKKLIELLQEKRTAVINQAVTKGLDPKVELIESGIEWIGKYPKDWDVKRLKSVCIVKRGASPRPIDDPIYFSENGEYSWVRISDVTASNKYLLETTEKLSTVGQRFSVRLKPGELIISIAATVGKPIINKIKCCIHDGFIYLKGLSINKEYAYYLFEIGEAYKGLGKMGTQLNLNAQTVGNISIPIPSADEQGKIIKYIIMKNESIDRLLERANKSIELLQEFKASLISNVVTGKVKI